MTVFYSQPPFEVRGTHRKLDSAKLRLTYQLTSPLLFRSFDSCKCLLSAFVNATALSFLKSAATAYKISNEDYAKICYNSSKSLNDRISCTKAEGNWGVGVDSRLRAHPHCQRFVCLPAGKYEALGNTSRREVGKGSGTNSYLCQTPG